MIAIVSHMTDDTSFVPFWRFTAGLIAALILVVPGQAASAALCTQWVSPTQATIGEIPVGFETLVPWSTDSDDYELRRQVVENYPFDVVALGPTGQRQTVDVAPDPDDPTVWRGSFSAATKGKWTIEVRNLESTGDRKCYTPLLIDVTEPGLGPWLLGGLVAVIAAIVAALAFVVRQRVANSS